VTGRELDLELVRQVVIEGLLILAGDKDRLRQLFVRHDTLVSDAEQYTDESADIVRGLAPRVNVYILHPEVQRQMPFVGIQMSGSSSGEETFSADIVDEVDKVIGSKVYCERIRGGYRDRSLRASVAASTWDATRCLHAAVAHVLDTYKWRLAEVGATGVSVTDSPPEVELPESAEDAVGRWSEGVVEVRYAWLMRTSHLLGPRPKRVILEWTGEV